MTAAYPPDIRLEKRELRALCREYRGSLTPEEKARMDGEIHRRLWEHRGYQSAKTALCYVSMEGEIDTRTLIRRMLEEGKRVGAPRCIPGTRLMEFHAISSLDELVPAAFGLLEPDPEKCPKITVSESTLCIVPGLAFDRGGYRIGYGGGYYDRFLSKNNLALTIGLSYSRCLFPRIPRGRYDVPCVALITEEETISIPRQPED